MTATDAEIRRTLRENGFQVGARGKLSDDHRAAYEDLTGTGTGDDHVTDLEDPAPAPPRDPPRQPPADTGRARPAAKEQRPRTVKRESSAGARLRAFTARRSGGQDQGGTKGKSRGGRTDRPKTGDRPWLPTAGIITTFWTRAAWSFSGIPPLQRILAAQAPMAGVVFQDRLRNTFTDRVILQPFARVEDQAEVGTAMVGVPAITAWIAFRGRCVMRETPDGPRPVLDEEGMPVWDDTTQMAVGLLKMALASWLKVSRKYAADVIAQAEEDIAISAEADKLIRWLFAPADPSQTWHDVQAEAAARAAQFTDAAQPGPPPPAPAPPGDARPSSAFRPALTGSVLPRM